MLLSTRRLDHISRTTCSFGRRSRSRSRPDPGAGRRTIQPTHCLRARIDATAHRGRLLRRSAALSASRLRATSNTLQQALLQPHGEPPAAAERRPAAAHVPRRSRGARGRARIAANAHHGRLLGRPAALSASPGRVTSGAPRGIPLRPQAEPRAASARLPMAASATPRPRRPTPRSDRRRCSPWPPPGALPAAIDIYAARHTQRAAARRPATA